jgi:hypothetical protein
LLGWRLCCYCVLIFDCTVQIAPRRVSRFVQQDSITRRSVVCVEIAAVSVPPAACAGKAQRWVESLPPARADWFLQLSERTWVLDLKVSAPAFRTSNVRSQSDRASLARWDAYFSPSSKTVRTVPAITTGDAAGAEQLDNVRRQAHMQHSVGLQT